MTTHKYVCQPVAGATYQGLFDVALQGGNVDRFDAAVAYATTQGVHTLSEILSDRASNGWAKMRKRWLVGIDWCRTDPTALDLLAAMDKSTVKIVNGIQVVGRKNCTPKISFHPKGYILRGVRSTAVIVGSGNLSRNGLVRGHEIGSVLASGEPETPLEAALKASCNSVCSWFDSMWKNADSFDGLRDAYIRRYESAENLKNPTPTEDDSIESDEPTGVKKGKGGLTVEQIRKLRAARHFWVEFVRNPNLGQEKPGSQLMMSRMMRVFFGFPADDLPKKSAIGEIRIEYGGKTELHSLQFAHNGMDVLNLPVPGNGGPPSYDDRVLLFGREAHGAALCFRLSLGNETNIREWNARSERVGGSYHMGSGRPWGVF